MMERAGINPQSKFKIAAHTILASDARQSLDQLYLPIIGTKAYALLNLLWGWSARVSEHFQLMERLSLDKQDLYRARQKCEGAGLLRTFVNNQNEVYYLLVSPLVPVAFFENPLLSQLLLEMVGESSFLELSRILLPAKPELADYQETTHALTSVFRFAATTPAQLVTNVKRNAAAVQTARTPTPQITFDFELLLSILKNSFVDLQTIKKAKPLFLATKELYGLDEVAQAKLIERATNLTTNRFDAQQFQLLVARKNKLQTTAPAADEPAKRGSQVSSTTKLSQQEQQLVAVAERTAPMIFLQGLKHEKGGFVTNGEERVLRSLVEAHQLEPGVINLLSYLLLVDRDYPTLNRNLVDTIANDWAQQKITTATGALVAIKNRQQQRKQQKTSVKRGNVRETLPQWAKRDATGQSEKPVSSAEKSELAKRLAKINHAKEDQDG
ncbi:DnaD domain protein [Fructilactobacillus florum]|uniref:Uncharacterized protein n=1 Tax=Fructilactobacillus florum DSM 22689 = JCM 16035 TaxID=1423745 RepID=A0A0R2CKU0_9LACO|nr:DnaD domain protein [Fructilactobacillus florum]KRM91840.1 hypothetical protein FC87_GL000665 [Fructilactobacillus florum DSM 22689 = JCM 16035]